MRNRCFHYLDGSRVRGFSPDSKFSFSTLLKHGDEDIIVNGTVADLPIFSGAMYLCKAHEKMESMAGYCVWMGDFNPINIPHRHLIESLPLILHSEGICCEVSGPFPAYLTGRFKQVSFAGIYIAI